MAEVEYISPYELWNNNFQQCPANENDQCRWKKSYNQHVNDPRLGPCEFSDDCPIFFWVETLLSEVQS